MDFPRICIYFAPLDTRDPTKSMDCRAKYGVIAYLFRRVNVPAVQIRYIADSFRPEQLRGKTYPRICSVNSVDCTHLEHCEIEFIVKQFLS